MRKLSFLFVCLILGALLISCDSNMNADLEMGKELFGSWFNENDEYDYNEDGNIYKNGEKTYKYEVLSDSKIRVYDSNNADGGYNDYDYSLNNGVLSYNNMQYSRDQNLIKQ